MSRNNNNTTGNLLEFAYFKKSYRLIAIDLSKQTSQWLSKEIIIMILKEVYGSLKEMKQK